jgi:hypothetical protein
MKKRYVVNLTDTERARLQNLIAAGAASARTLMHARIVLKADQSTQGPGETDDAIARAVAVSQPTVFRVRRPYVEQGLEAALNRRPPTREYPRKLDGAPEVHLIALACATPPNGQARWSLRLLADKLVELEVVDAVSYQTVRRVLKNNELKPWLRQQWCIPPPASGVFVWRMEDVLEVYTRPYDPRRPLIGLDEMAKQLLRNTRAPRLPASGRVRRVDYEYERNGVVNGFLFGEPLRGQRWVDVTERRTKVDWAYQMRRLVAVCYPEAERIVLVLDNRTTHARRPVRRLPTG